jgi:uncharacterized protein (TIGR03067 family)
MTRGTAKLGVLLLSLVVLALASARGGDTSKVEADRAAFKGRWDLTSYRSNGETMLRGARGFRYFFDASFYAFSRNYGISEEGDFTIDPTKTPKTIDFQLQLESGKTLTRLGIYEIEGDILKLCFSTVSPDVRPRTLSDQRGSDQYVYVLDRVKE